MTGFEAFLGLSSFNLRFAMNLLRRLEATHMTISNIRYVLPQVREAEEVFVSYELAHASIEQYIQNTHSEWFHTIEAGIQKELHGNLMVIDKQAGAKQKLEKTV